MTQPAPRPRPRFDPGPRQAPCATPPQKVPGQARDAAAVAHRAHHLGAPVLTTLAALLLTSPLSAQVIPTGTPAADILLSQAIAEHRVFLTCSALDPATHRVIVDKWQRDVTSAAATLTANKVPPEAVAAFTTAAKPENLLPAPDTPWVEVQSLCATHPDWQTIYFEFNAIILELKLPKAFE